jgi:thymidylate synthase
MTNYPIKENKMTIKKRGRPAGSKNKSKALKRSALLTFEKQIEAWEKKENEVNYKELSEKLQEALAKSYVESDGLKKTIETLSREINARDIIITYLEIRKV